MTGKFLKGNEYGGMNLPSGVPHPEYPHLDTTGHPLPGCSLNPVSGAKAKGESIPHSVHQLKLELMACANRDDIQAVYQKLFQMTQSDAHGGGNQLEAIKLYLERFFGKPTAEVNMNTKSTSTTTKVNVDLTALSEDELRTYMSLQGKVQSTLMIEGPKTIDVEDSKGELVEG